MIDKIPEAFCLPLRLKLVGILLQGDKSFAELKELTKATDGNISVQLTKLEEWGYIHSEKKIIGRRVKSTYSITQRGVSEFEDYVLLLENMLKMRVDLIDN